MSLKKSMLHRGKLNFYLASYFITFLKKKSLSTILICKLSPVRLGEIGSPLLQWSVLNCFQIGLCGIVSIEMVRTKDLQLLFFFLSLCLPFRHFSAFLLVQRSEGPCRGSC